MLPTLPNRPPTGRRNDAHQNDCRTGIMRKALAPGISRAASDGRLRATVRGVKRIAGPGLPFLAKTAEYVVQSRGRRKRKNLPSPPVSKTPKSRVHTVSFTAWPGFPFAAQRPAISPIRANRNAQHPPTAMRTGNWLRPGRGRRRRVKIGFGHDFLFSC